MFVWLRRPADFAARLKAAAGRALPGLRPERGGDGGRVLLRTSDARYPILYRAGTSDTDVFSQVFTDREYSCLDDVAAADLVVDCGTSIGCSAAYFLTRFPGCELIAVEPDPGSFEVLSLNLRPYGPRARAIQAAVWSRPADLAFARRGYRDGRAWTTQVRECGPDAAAEVRGVDMASLLAGSGHDRISILKIDVEGAEAELFKDPDATWLDHVDHLVIELHDDTVFGNCSAIFARALSGRPFAISRHGELTVCRRNAR